MKYHPIKATNGTEPVTPIQISPLKATNGTERAPLIQITPLGWNVPLITSNKPDILVSISPSIWSF